MTISIDAGDPAQGLRRALGLTGRIPLSLDETGVPVFISRDASLAPYAANPKYCTGRADASGTAAPAIPAVQLVNNTGGAETGVVAIVDRIEFVSGAAAQSWNIVLARRQPYVGVILGTTGVLNDENQGTLNEPQHTQLQIFADAVGAPGHNIATREPYVTAVAGSFQDAWVSPWAPPAGGLLLYANNLLTVTGSQSGAASTMTIIFYWREFQLRSSS